MRRILIAAQQSATSNRGKAIIAPFPSNGIRIMEAEQLNSISNKLDDLAQRADELRRYL